MPLVPHLDVHCGQQALLGQSPGPLRFGRFFACDFHPSELKVACCSHPGASSIQACSPRGLNPARGSIGELDGESLYVSEIGSCCVTCTGWHAFNSMATYRTRLLAVKLKQSSF